MHVVDFLIDTCGLDFNEEDIFKMHGIIATNATNVESQNLRPYKNNGLGLFPTVSIMSHSCISNAKCL